jgi:uncharacterized protein YggE
MTIVMASLPDPRQRLAGGIVTGMQRLGMFSAATVTPWLFERRRELHAATPSCGGGVRRRVGIRPRVQRCRSGVGAAVRRLAGDRRRTGSAGGADERRTRRRQWSNDRGRTDPMTLPRLPGWLPALGLIAALATASPAAAADDQRPLVPSITVTGSGSTSVPPDTATIFAGVVTQAPSAAMAVSANNAIMETVLRALGALGIADKDVQTTEFNVSPQYRQTTDGTRVPEIAGHEVLNRVRVTVRDLGQLGKVLDEVIKQGANRIDSIRFAIGDPAPATDEARSKAMADARRRAGVYAAAANVSVGRVLLIQESTAAIPIPRPVASLRASAVPIAPGEQEITVTVSVTYSIE